MPLGPSLLSRMVLAICLLVQGQVFAGAVQLPAGTRIYVETTQELVAKGDRVTQGQIVGSKIWRDVVANGHVLIAAGTPVVSRVDHVKKRQIAGIKGEMTIGAYETQSIDGQKIQLSGGYHKEGKSRMALSITLGVLLILPIFIPGQAAELPAGTVFDANVDQNQDVFIGDSASPKTIDLSYYSTAIEAELLYDNLAAEEKPKYFDFQITVPVDAPRDFVIDRVNGEEINPIKLKVLSETTEDDEAIVMARVKIKTLVKKFTKGINSIEIANPGRGERTSTKMIVDIEI